MRNHDSVITKSLQDNSFSIQRVRQVKNDNFSQKKSAIKVPWLSMSQMVSTPDFGSQCFGFESHCRQYSFRTSMALHCTEPFMFTLPSPDMTKILLKSQKPSLVVHWIFHISLSRFSVTSRTILSFDTYIPFDTYIYSTFHFQDFQ